MSLLTRGNDKIGEGVYAFSLPAVSTCPGLTAVCKRNCYARSGRYRFRPVKRKLADSLKASKAGDFAAVMAREVRRRGAVVVRVHVSGDFYSARYAEKWIDAVRLCPNTIFYAYTRSWRVPEMADSLAALAALENVWLWYSADADSGYPEHVPEGVRVCWLQTYDGERVPDGVDLVFRLRHLRASREATTVPLRMVCPTELPRANDDEAATCGSCQRCFRG